MGGWHSVDNQNSETSKGQSAMLGIILLIGIVAITCFGIFLAAGQTVSHVEHQAEQERIEQTFVELSHNIATVASNGDTSQEMGFEAGDLGAVTKSNSGWIKIEADGVSENLTMGAIEYVGDDGSLLAYQSGGVWRETGNQTQMLSAPPVHYDSSDKTLTLPVTNLTESETDLVTGDVTISHEQTDSVTDASVIEYDTVTITIHSDYYRGWEQYFETQASDNAVHNIDHNNQTVTIEFGLDEADGDFSSALTAQGGGIQSNVPCNPGQAAPIDGPVQTNGDTSDCIDATPLNNGPTPIDSIIESHVESLIDDSDAKNPEGENPLTSEDTYFNDGDIELSGQNVDLSEGNITLVVNGDVKVTETINVNNARGTDNAFRIYATGNLHLDNAGVYENRDNNELRGKHVQFYGTSNSVVGIQGGVFEGTIYAPRTEAALREGEENPAHLSNGKGNSCELDGAQQADLCLTKNGQIQGSAVAGPATISTSGAGGGSSIVWDEDLDTVDPELHLDGALIPPDITYFNLSVYEMEITNSE